MQQALLILNSGSSSLKFSIYAVTKAKLFPAPIIDGQIEALDEQPFFLAKAANNIILAEESLTLHSQQDVQAFALDYLLNWLDENLHTYSIVAAGHRVVHGADEFYRPVEINANILEKLESFNSLAPLHQPYNIAGIRALIKKITRYFAGCLF